MAAGREGYGDPYVASSLPELGPGSIQTTVLQVTGQKDKKRGA